MRIHVIAAFLSVGKLKRVIFCRGMQQVLFDVDFGYVLRTTAADLILSQTQNELHYFFFNYNISKKPKAHCCSESKTMPASIVLRLRQN